MKQALSIFAMTTLATLTACQSDVPEGAEANIQEYAEQMALLNVDMSEAEVEAAIGEPYYREKSTDGRAECWLVRGTATDGRAIVHDVLFKDDQMKDHIVGLDYNIAACNPNAER